MLWNFSDYLLCFLGRLNSSNGKFHPNLSLLFPIKTTSHQLNGPNQQTHTFKERDMAMYFNTNILLLGFFAITGILVSGNNNNMVVGDDCQGDMQGLVAQCAMYVQKSLPKMNPSQQCCSVIQIEGGHAMRVPARNQGCWEDNWHGESDLCSTVLWQASGP